MRSPLKKLLGSRAQEQEAARWADKYDRTFKGKATFDEAQEVWEDIMLNYLCLYDTLENQEEVIRHNVALQLMARRGILNDKNVRSILRIEQGIPPYTAKAEGEDTEDVPRTEL